jgi:hypothetical protein
MNFTQAEAKIKELEQSYKTSVIRVSECKRLVAVEETKALIIIDELHQLKTNYLTAVINQLQIQLKAEKDKNATPKLIPIPEDKALSDNIDNPRSDNVDPGTSPIDDTRADNVSTPAVSSIVKKNNTIRGKTPNNSKAF